MAKQPPPTTDLKFTAHLQRPFCHNRFSSGVLWPPAETLCLYERQNTFMKQFTRVFTPTRNRRLNELIGFLLFVSAVLLFLALASYSPQDPSLNTAASPAHHSANNWFLIAAPPLSYLLLQYGG